MTPPWPAVKYDTTALMTWIRRSVAIGQASRHGLCQGGLRSGPDRASQRFAV